MKTARLALQVYKDYRVDYHTASLMLTVLELSLGNIIGYPNIYGHHMKIHKTTVQYYYMWVELA